MNTFIKNAITNRIQRLTKRSSFSKLFVPEFLYFLQGQPVWKVLD